MKNKNTLVGKTFERYTVIEFSHMKKRHAYWRCICECGNERLVQESSLKNGGSKSCGCLRIERLSKIGGLCATNPSEYDIWRGMIRRCTDSKNSHYKYYGGRGIKVCNRWLESSENFIEDMNKRPGKKFSIDRVDNNGHYCKENCRWATSSEQAFNKNGIKKYTYNGESKTITEWAETIGINRKTLASRIYKLKMPIEKALTIPTRNKKQRTN